jgi:hypothetical protein
MWGKGQRATEEDGDWIMVHGLYNPNLASAQANHFVNQSTRISLHLVKLQYSGRW